MHFELARPTDEPALRRLLRQTPMRGAISLTMECEPCIHFANSIEGTSSQTLVARPAAPDPIVAMGTRTLLDCYVNGRATQIGYLGQLRILPQFRSHPTLLRRGYASLRRLHDAGGAEFYVTTIAADNEPARRVLEAGLADLPTYKPMGDLVTFLVPTSRQRESSTKVQVDGAKTEDLDAIIACLARNGTRHQLTPHWTRAILLSASRARNLGIKDFFVARRGSDVIGCVACWDQRGFKQVVVRGYSRTLYWARPFANLLSPLTGVPRLPSIGTPVALAYASHLGVDGNEPEVFAALINAALRSARQRGIDQIAFGLHDQHPLMTVAKDRFRSRHYRSCIYLVHWDDGADAAQRVDTRPIHLEVAIL